MREYVQQFKNQNLNKQLLVIMFTLTIITAVLTTRHESLIKLTGAFAVFTGILWAWNWYNDTLAQRLTVIFSSILILSETIIKTIFPHSLDKLITYLTVASMMWWLTQASQKSTGRCIAWMVFMPLVAFMVLASLTSYIPIPHFLPLLTFPICWIGMCFYADALKMEKVLFISAIGMFGLGTAIFFAMDYLLIMFSEENTLELTEVAQLLQTFHLYNYIAATAMAIIFFICWYIVIKRKRKTAQ